MNPLASRKQILVAESELNRSQLAADWEMMAEEVRGAVGLAKGISSLVSIAALLLGGLACFRRKKAAPPGDKPSWWRTLLKVAQLAGSIWSGWRWR